MIKGKENSSSKENFPLFPDENKKCVISLFIENKLIFISQTGVFLYSQIDSGETKKFLFPGTQYSAFKGLINIDKKGNLIALTSNEIIPKGENLLLFYDISDKYNMKIKKAIPGYSFNIEPNGLSMIYLDSKKDKRNKVEEEYLICACKKYNHGQRNGILLVDIKNHFRDSFFDTDKFEVYCFYSITEKKEKINGYEILGTEFFLAGGFDQILGEGKIKLFMLIEDKNTKEKKIKFLQDIVVDSQITKIEYDDEKVDETQVNNRQNKDEIFTGFNGSISSITQSKYDGNIIVNCYDGKKSLFTRPNLELYRKKLDDNY